MLVKGAFEKARIYIESHTKLSEEYEEFHDKSKQGPCITISRETGAGADRVSEELIEFFKKYESRCSYPWTVFDKNIIEKILEDHHLPQKLEKFLVEDKLPEFRSVINELLGIHPSKWILVRKTIITILKLAQTGNVVIVGRAGNVITEKQKNTFHVRLVGSFEDRVKHVAEIYKISREDAIDFVKKEDTARKNYFMTYFHRDLNDPLLYNMIINTSRVNYEMAAEMIGHAVVKKFPNIFIRKKAKSTLEI